MKKTHILALLGGALALSSCAGDGQDPSSAGSSDLSSSSSLSVSLSEGEVYVAFYNGDRLVTTLTGQPGEAMRKPANQRRTGHSFLGWAQDPDAKKAEKLPEKFPEESRIYYAIFKVEEYELTFENHPTFDGTYEFGQDLPQLEQDTFNVFNGWYCEEYDSSDIFLVVPDLGGDGEAFTLKASQDSKNLTINFLVPDGYEQVESMVVDSFSADLPSYSISEAGRYFAGWSFVNSGSNYGEEADGSVCFEHLTEATSYLSYIQNDEDGNPFVNLYPVAAEETYNITLLDRDGSSLGNLSTSKQYKFGDALPDFATYRQYNDNADYVGLAGWSTSKSASQTSENTYLTVKDFGEDGASITLYANVRTIVFTIDFAQGEGVYLNGETSYRSTDFFTGDDLSNIFVQTTGYIFSGFTVEEDKTSGKVYTSLPKLNDTTLFNIPDDGVYTLTPVTKIMSFTMYGSLSDDDAKNIPSLSDGVYDSRCTSRYTDGRVLRTGDKFAYPSGDSSSTSVIGDEMFVARGHELTSLELYGSIDINNPSWVLVGKLNRGESAIMKFKYFSAYEKYKRYCFKAAWTTEEYEVEIEKPASTSLRGKYYAKWTYGQRTSHFYDADGLDCSKYYNFSFNDYNLNGVYYTTRYIYGENAGQIVTGKGTLYNKSSVSDHGEGFYLVDATPIEYKDYIVGIDTELGVEFYFE